MPLRGRLDPMKTLADAPLLSDPAREPWPLPDAWTIHLLFEIDSGVMLDLLPPALHPTLPPTAQILFTHAPESPAGPFTLAQVRVGCRAGPYQRGYSARAFCDSQRACEALRARWGFDAHVADVKIARRHDRAEGRVERDGRALLDVALIDPIPIGVGDVRIVDGLNLARVAKDGGEVARLVQVDPGQEIKSADRGRPWLGTFDAAAFGAEKLRPGWPVSGSFTLADLTLPALRYLIDPLRPPAEGTERL